MDGISRQAQAGLRRALRRGRMDRVLRGSWLGHPVHPILIVGPIGTWLSASVLDIGGQRDAARTLVAAGLVAAPATVVAGLADWSDMPGPQRRTGTLHAATNVVASGCYLASYLCRRRGAHTAGAALAAAGLLGLSAGGAMGGHLAYALGGGVHRWQQAPE